jgi:hypothetical protein
MQMSNELPSYRCRRIAKPFTIDGNISKTLWQSMPVIEMRLAVDGGLPIQSTFVRSCWDGANLYLAFECQDMDIRATMVERDDRVWQEEAVEAFIAPYGDLRHYYEFQCSPINVVRDLKVTSPNARPGNEIFDGSWDCSGWRTAVCSLAEKSSSSLISRGWGGEWRIPLSELLGPGAGPVLPAEEWRVNLFRIDRWPREEYSSWAATPGLPLSFHRPTCFGRWIFE